MKRRLGSVAFIAACMALLIGLVAPPPVHAGPAGGTLAVSGMVTFLGRGGSTSGGFPCKSPTASESACEAKWSSSATIEAALSGTSAEGTPFSVALATNVKAGAGQSDFTYMNDLGAGLPECTQSYGAGRLDFNTAGAASQQAFGSYHDTENGVPRSIVGARGWLEYRWRGVGTAMSFVVIGLLIEVEVFRPAPLTNQFKVVMQTPVSSAGANGAGVFAPTSTSAGPALACATNTEGTSPMTATAAWDFALNASE